MNSDRKVCLITNDVETTSIINNRLSTATGDKVHREALPELLEIYEEFGVKATFFFNGDILENSPEVVQLVLPGGHEVASHGLVHEVDQAFDVLSFEEQVLHLKVSKSKLEELSGQSVVSFRAPALRVNCDTPVALAEAGYLIDSSVASQRLDMFLSFGSIRKLKWLRAPRGAYRSCDKDLSRKGAGSIIEVPVSTIGIPYIGTVMRISPALTRMTRFFLGWEASRTGRPVVFLIHPNELVKDDVESGFNRRTRNPVAFLLADLLRSRLKRRNLGTGAAELLRDQLRYWKEQGFEFMTVRDYVERTGLLDDDGKQPGSGVM